jgi:hypothetical protein
MNKNPLLDIPKLSRIVIRRARSVFDLKTLPNVEAELLPKLGFVRATQVSRWNE